MKKLFIILILFISSAAYADSFTVKSIDIEGLQRIDAQTVYDYLPLQIGAKMDQQASAEAIRALYQTGFFSHVALAHKGDTLIIQLQERPTIAYISVSGNKIVPTDALLGVLTSVGVAKGHIYDKSVLDNVKESLQNQYLDRGNYNASVSTHITDESQNRVGINIQVHEGSNTKIKQIKIIGNHVFKEKTLLKLFSLKSSDFFSFATKDDRYSKEALDVDLEALRAFYLDHGYVKFKIESSQVSITPDREDVYVEVRVNEGDQYTLKDFHIVGKSIFRESQLRALIDLPSGDVFSRSRITDATEILGNYFSDFGFAFASIRPVPEINDEDKTVSVTFFMESKHKVYVRRIHFIGNTKTEDEVLRREMRLQEGAIASREKLKQSEHRLNMLGYFKKAAYTAKPVEGAGDQMDLDFHVIESPSATFTVGAGYSDTERFIINGGFNQPNFLGTGDVLGMSFNSSRYSRSYGASFFDPYYTTDGVGRGFSLYANVYNYDKSEVGNYSADRYGLSSYYSIPVSENHSVNFGYGYQIANLTIGNRPSRELLSCIGSNAIETDINSFGGKSDAGLSSEQIWDRYQLRKSALNEKCHRFRNVLLNAGWSYVNLDRGVLPTKGYTQGVSLDVALPGGGEPLSYFKANWIGHGYLPMGRGFVLSVRGELGYGDGLFGTAYLPFFENYYAGGIGVPGAVRGYEGLSLGPSDSNGKNFGGNFLAGGSLALIIPVPFLSEAMRTSVFYDIGNTYSNVNTTTGSGPLRSSLGLSFEWQSPVGPFIVSYARGLNTHRGDHLNSLQFSVGTNL